MTEQAYILAATGQPFRDWDAANVKRQILAGEVDDAQFDVVDHPDGGYAVLCNVVELSIATSSATDAAHRIPESPAETLAREMSEEFGRNDTDEEVAEIGGVLPPVTTAERSNALSVEDAKGDTQRASDSRRSANGFPRNFSLTVAPRAFLHLHVATLLGLWLSAFPHTLFAPLGNFEGFDYPILETYVLGVTQLAGIVLAVGASAKFIYACLWFRYCVTPDSVEATYGWIARDAPKVFFAHIRTTCVVQSWWERLLMVGAVKIGTGATDDHEVILKHISNPRLLERELEARYLPFIRAQRPTEAVA